MYRNGLMSLCVLFGNTVVYCYLWSRKSVGRLKYSSQKAILLSGSKRS